MLEDFKSQHTAILRRRRPSGRPAMPSSTSGQVGTTASAVVAFLSLLFFTRKLVRARAYGAQAVQTTRTTGSTSRTTATSTSRSSNSRGTGGGSATAFTVGLLDIAIPRDDRQGGTFPRIMINDACIHRAVQEVSRKLVVSLRDTESVPSGVVRAYVSEIYQGVYDAAFAARRPNLDVRVLLPAAINDASTSGKHASRASGREFAANGGTSGETGTVNSAPGTNSSLVWATREIAELEPDVDVLFSDQPKGGGRHATINAERIKAGIPPLQVMSLESIAKKAHRPEYFYAEDTLANIPTFSSVACGGTFDRLHGGHKKLLTLAASMCPEGTLTVGVTSDSMLKGKSNSAIVTSLTERLEGVEDFLRTLNPTMSMRVEEITDPFGPPVAEEAFDAIAVSSETVSGAEKINELRAQKGFRPLAVAVTRRMAAATLSSSYLRRAAEKQLDKENRRSKRQNA